MASVTVVDYYGNYLARVNNINEPHLKVFPINLRNQVKSLLREKRTITITYETFIPGKKWQAIQLPTTDNCNLLCKHCVRVEKYLGKDVSFETLKKYLSSFSQDMCEFLLLSDFGEPFLRKDILEILRYAQSQGFHNVTLVTNGILLTEPIIKAIVSEKLLTKILISTEGASKKMYEEIRGAHYGIFVSNVKKLTEYNRKINSHNISILLNTTCFKDNLHELPMIMDFAHELSVDGVCFVHLNAVAFTPENKLMSKYKGKVCIASQYLDRCNGEEILNIFKQVHEKALRYKITYTPPENYLTKTKENTGNCDMPYKWIQVNSEGNVYPCCQISKKYSMGNLNVNSFQEIWDNEKYVNFREGLKNGTPHEECKKCNVYNGKNF